MTKLRKQLKITKLFKNTASKIPDECDELQDEVKELEQKLREKQSELFQIQRNALRRKVSPPKKREDSFVRPQRIILSNSIESLKKNLGLTSMLSGIEVQSYVAGEQCCVVFHMQHASEHVIKHGLRIDMTSGRNEISSMSLPLGFNFRAVMEDYNNVMKPDCLGAIRRALVAYYDRLEQYRLLKELLNLKADLFKTLDGSHVEISFYVQGRDEEEDRIQVTLELDYRLYDVRPKSYSIKHIDITEDVVDLIRLQCTVFKNKPLARAFKEGFLAGVGQYALVHQISASPRSSPRRVRPNKHNAHNDDTFLPEHCSDQGEDDH